MAKENSKKENTRVVESEVVKSVREQIRLDALGVEFERLKLELAGKDSLIADLHRKSNEYRALIDNDTELVELEASSQLLGKSHSTKEVELDSLNYECFKLNQLQKMAIEQKEQQSIDKRKLLDELDKYRGENWIYLET